MVLRAWCNLLQFLDYIGSNGGRDGKPKQTRVTRYTMDRKEPYQVDPKSALIVIGIRRVMFCLYRLAEHDA